MKDLGAALAGALSYPGSLRAAIVRRLWPRWMNLGSYGLRLERGLVERAYYGYCMYAAAKLARNLGHKVISAIEFGVASGNGLLAAERHAARISSELGVEFSLFGFDAGAGLPAPRDYRDLPHYWRAGFYRLDQEALQRRLRCSTLVIGDVRDTVPGFFSRYAPPPVGCVFFDLDFYSSTMDSFALFAGEHHHLLPRIFLYFDDIIGADEECFNDFTGERRAIQDFNAQHEQQKICPAYHLACRSFPLGWFHQVFVYHDFSHPEYNTYIGAAEEVPLG